VTCARTVWRTCRGRHERSVPFGGGYGGRGYVDLHQAACSVNLMLDGLVFQACKNAKVEKSGVRVFRLRLSQPHSRPTLARFFTSRRYGRAPYDADHMYGWAKLMAEMTLRAYHQDWGMKSASCRYFTVYGPRGVENHAVIAMIARAFVKQDPFAVWGTGEQIRNWTYVDDIVAGTILAAEKLTTAPR